MRLENDRSVFLMIAAYGTPKHKRESFLQASEELRGDKAFMMKVVAKDPLLFSCASTELQNDFDLGILAFSSSPDVVEDYMASPIQGTRIRIIRRLYDHIKNCIQSVNAFREFVRWEESTSFCLGQPIDAPRWLISKFLLGSVSENQLRAWERAGKHLNHGWFCETDDSALCLKRGIALEYEG